MVDSNFQNIYHRLSLGNEVGNHNFHMHDGLLFHLGKLCISNGDRNDLNKEAHTSCIHPILGLVWSIFIFLRFVVNFNWLKILLKG